MKQEMFAGYAVKWHFTGRLMAGLPQDEKSLVGKLEAAGRPDLVPEVQQEVGGPPAEPEEVVRLVFKRDGYLYQGGYTVKAHIKNCAHALAKAMKDGENSLAGYRAKVADRVYVIEDRIPLMRIGGERQIAEPDGEWVHPISVQTRQGPRTAIKINEYVEGAEMQFTLAVLNDGVVTEDMICDLMTYGAIHGYGAERGLQHGRYRFSLARMLLTKQELASLTQINRAGEEADSDG